MANATGTGSLATGVCVVRAEPQGDALLITVTSNADVESFVPTRLSRYALSTERTLQLVADFLHEVAALNQLD